MWKLGLPLTWRFRASAILCHVSCCVVTDTSKECCAFISGSSSTRLTIRKLLQNVFISWHSWTSQKTVIISNLTISAACYHMLYHSCTLIMLWPPSSKSRPCPSSPVTLPLMLYGVKCLQCYRTNCYTSLQSLKYFMLCEPINFFWHNRNPGCKAQVSLTLAESVLCLKEPGEENIPRNHHLDVSSVTSQTLGVFSHITRKLIFFQHYSYPFESCCLKRALIVGLKYNLECSLILVLSSKYIATQNNATIHFSLKIVCYP